MMRKLISSGLALAALLAVARMAPADPLPAGGCPETCLKPCCRPVVEPKTVIKPVYREVCEDFCVVACPGGCFLNRCKTCGPDHKCLLQTRKILVVKLCKEEHCVNRCVLDYVPGCAAPAPCAAPCATPVPVMPPATAAPAPLPLRMPMPGGR